MFEISIVEVRNGFIVNVNKTVQAPVINAGLDFGKMMEIGAKTMMKEMNKDETLSKIEDENKEEEKYLGTHVFLKYSEVIGFLKLLKD